ncbi:MAG: hypothetical protein ACMUIE_07960 [Thermoplasmatota archaeon]
MEMSASFRNLPSVHQTVYGFMLVGIPMIAAVSIAVMMVLGIADFVIYVIPVAFGLASPAVILKDLLVKKNLSVKDGTLVFRTGKKAKEVERKEIMGVIVLRVKDRLVIIVCPKNMEKMFGVDDWFNIEDKRKLLELLGEMSGESKFEIEEFTDKNEAMRRTKLIYGIR